MRRRQLLALSGSLLAGTAGCLSASAPEAAPAEESNATTGAGSTTGSTTDQSDPSTDTPDTTTDEYADVSIAFDALQPGLVTMTSPDSIGVSSRDRRYLLVEVTTDGDGRPPAPESFSFEVGGTAYSPEPVDQPWRIWRFYDDESALYDRESGEGLLLFEFPDDPTGSGSSTGATSSDDTSAGSADAGPVLTWPGGEWRPDESVRRRLARPEPPLSVSVDVPETVAFGESPDVSVTVDNGGDVPGRFVAGLNRIGPMVAYAPVERVSLLVPAAGSETWELDDGSIMADSYPEDRIGDGEGDMTYHLNWADGDVRQGVRYAE